LRAFVGSAFVPAGASCTYYPGPFAPPSCTCDVGPYATGQWTNAATGGTGPLQLGVLGNDACIATTTAWIASGIALEPGSNLISLSMTDGDRRGTATVTVLRE